MVGEARNGKGERRMAEPISFNFADYVRRRKADVPAVRDPESSYAFAGDLELQAYVRKLPPLVAVMDAAVRLSKTLRKNELLGSAVLVTPKQFPAVHALVAKAADRLSVAMPTVYISQQMNLNAHTFGTEDDSYIVLPALTPILNFSKALAPSGLFNSQYFMRSDATSTPSTPSLVEYFNTRNGAVFSTS